MTIDMDLPTTICVLVILLKMATRKTDQINVRIDPELNERLAAACKHARLKVSQVVSECLYAFCEQVEGEGGVWFPLKIVPKHEKKRATSLEDIARGSRSISAFPDGPILRAADEPGEPVERKANPVIYGGRRRAKNRPALEEQARTIPGQSLHSKHGSKKS